MSTPLLPLRHAATVLVSNVDKKAVEGDPAVRLVNYTDVYYNSQITPDLDLMAATAKPEQIARFQVRAGDTIITKDSESPEDIGIPTYVAGADPDMVCGYHLALIRPGASFHPKFLHWVLESDRSRQHFAIAANGMTRFGLTYTAIQSVAVPCPPLDIQRRIADFLDDQTTRIDNIIAARGEQVEGLREYVRSFSENAVWNGLTRGPTSPTGIGPAPLAPKHWKRIRNKYLFTERVELSVNGEEELLTVSHLTGITPRAEKVVTMFMADDLAGYKVVHPNDLVINTLWAWMGALGVSQLHGIVSPAYGVYRPIHVDLVSGYMDHLYRSTAYVCEMTRHSKGVWSSRLRLYPEAFLALWSLLPPKAEQLQIAREIREVESTEAGRVRLLEKSLESLQEFKRSLISAAVSGEFDVSTASGRGVPA